MAQSKNKLVGTWKLVSVISKTDKGDVNKTVYGAHPKGFITYTADGRMIVIITGDGKPLSVNNRVAAPLEEPTPPISRGGVMQTFELTWERILTGAQREC